MRRKRYSEEQIIKILKLAEAGHKVKDICREYGIAEQTYYRWKSKCGGMEVTDPNRRRIRSREWRCRHGVSRRALRAL